ncbi:hypothetical protein ASC66_01395 [Leifsonia sp. Root4]|uniref:hypothetical protein n=1 Tax=Leifsonia sp. Root4 TaxID=1736525 RepID=UPI0006F7692E|nr:hypothetical protein [Leifsonia sp. Root4]KQW07682.1 hypothetical protein ASC66_01395 [Leifsonia sp. Root4]
MRRLSFPNSFRRNFRSEQGSASLEFLTVGMILLVPLVYLVLVMSALQAGALAAEGAARQAARAFVLAESDAAGQSAAARALAVTLDDYGLTQDESELVVDCSAGGACLVRGETVTVHVRISVSLPFVPDVLELQNRASVPMTAASTQRVSKFWGGG